MKLFYVLLLITVLSFTNCTEQARTKAFGGTMTIELEKGERLIEATWKDTQLWYLTEPMKEDYVPNTKTFREQSSFGMMEGKVVFKESR